MTPGTFRELRCGTYDSTSLCWKSIAIHVKSLFIHCVLTWVVDTRVDQLKVVCRIQNTGLRPDR